MLHIDLRLLRANNLLLTYLVVAMRISACPWSWPWNNFVSLALALDIKSLITRLVIWGKMMGQTKLVQISDFDDAFVRWLSCILNIKFMRPFDH